MSSFNPERPCTGLDITNPGDLAFFLELETSHIPPYDYAYTRNHIFQRSKASAIIKECGLTDPAASFLAMNYFDNFTSTHQVPAILRKPVENFDIFVTCCYTLAIKTLNPNCDITGSSLGGSWEKIDLYTMEHVIDRWLENRGCKRPITSLAFLDFFINNLLTVDDTRAADIKDYATHSLYALQYGIQCTIYKPSILAAAAILYSWRNLFWDDYNVFAPRVFDADYLDETSLSQALMLYGTSEPEYWKMESVGVYTNICSTSKSQPLHDCPPDVIVTYQPVSGRGKSVWVDTESPPLYIPGTTKIAVSTPIVVKCQQETRKISTPSPALIDYSEPAIDAALRGIREALHIPDINLSFDAPSSSLDSVRFRKKKSVWADTDIPPLYDLETGKISTCTPLQYENNEPVADTVCSPLFDYEEPLTDDPVHLKNIQYLLGEPVPADTKSSLDRRPIKFRENADASSSSLRTTPLYNNEPPSVANIEPETWKRVLDLVADVSNYYNLVYMSPNRPEYIHAASSSPDFVPASSSESNIAINPIASVEAEPTSEKEDCGKISKDDVSGPITPDDAAAQYGLTVTLLVCDEPMSNRERRIVRQSHKEYHDQVEEYFGNATKPVIAHSIENANLIRVRIEVVRTKESFGFTYGTVDLYSTHIINNRYTFGYRKGFDEYSEREVTLLHFDESYKGMMPKNGWSASFYKGGLWKQVFRQVTNATPEKQIQPWIMFILVVYLIESVRFKSVYAFWRKSLRRCEYGGIGNIVLPEWFRDLVHHWTDYSYFIQSPQTGMNSVIPFQPFDPQIGTETGKYLRQHRIRYCKQLIPLMGVLKKLKGTG